MGYVCPICSAAATDAVGLANHLAVTASLGRDNHREWLDDHAPDWGQHGPEELAETVRTHAQPIDDPAVDAAPDTPQPPLEAELAAQSQQRGRGTMAIDTDGVLEEARELSQQMAPDETKAEDASNREENG